MSGINFTTPVGRIVQGSLYKGNDTDAEGKPLVIKSGPNIGKPRLDYFFALAIPKGAETHWSQTDWGQKILQIGATAFPQAYQSPAFAWKIKDGDSPVPNKRGRAPKDMEGHPGNWVLSLSSGFAPKIYKLQDGTRDQYLPFMDVDAVKPGYYVQVNVNCDGNGSQSQPGVYLNHSMVCFAAFGTEIVFGPDVASAGFGGAALPAGASVTPPAGAFAGVAPALPGAAPALPVVGGIPAPGMMLPMMPPPAAPAPAAPIGLPVLVGVPGAAYSVEALRAQGWSDAQILQGGYATQQAPAAAVGLPPLPPVISAPAAPAFAAPVAPVAVTPNVGFVQMAAGLIPPPAAAAGAIVMNPGAPGTYEQFKAQGYSDDQIVQGGYGRRA